MSTLISTKEVVVDFQILALLPQLIKFSPKSHQQPPDLAVFLSSPICNVIFAFICKHRCGLLCAIPVDQIPVACFADMKYSPITKTTSKALFFLLLLLFSTVTTASDDLDLLDYQDYDLSQGRFLSNEVLNGNSSLLLGLQTTLNGVYDYIGC